MGAFDDLQNGDDDQTLDLEGGSGANYFYPRRPGRWVAQIDILKLGERTNEDDGSTQPFVAMEYEVTDVLQCGDYVPYCDADGYEPGKSSKDIGEYEEGTKLQYMEDAVFPASHQSFEDLGYGAKKDWKRIFTLCGALLRIPENLLTISTAGELVVPEMFDDEETSDYAKKVSGNFGDAPGWLVGVDTWVDESEADDGTTYRRIRHDFFPVAQRHDDEETGSLVDWLSEDEVKEQFYD
jgi:hypothetical protein